MCPGWGWKWWPGPICRTPSSCPLQEWVTVTDLLISLNRLNTFGDDIFKDPKVLQSYYYAISDFSVGGR